MADHRRPGAGPVDELPAKGEDHELTPGGSAHRHSRLALYRRPCTLSGRGLYGGFVFLLLTGIGLATAEMEARAVLVVVGPTVGLLLGILALPGLTAGYGLLNHKPWARILAIVVGIIGLVNFPSGPLSACTPVGCCSPRRHRNGSHRRRLARLSNVQGAAGRALRLPAVDFRQPS
jgi:hypothetical protein